MNWISNLSNSLDALKEGGKNKMATGLVQLQYVAMCTVQHDQLHKMRMPCKCKVIIYY